MCPEITTTWLDYFSAIAPSLIAVVAVAIASQQWFTNRNTLKLQLFDRRIEVYQSITHYLGYVQVGDPANKQEEHIKFLKATKDAYYLFGDDIKEFVNEIKDKCIRLQSLEREFTGNISEDERNKNIKKQSEIDGWLRVTLINIEPKFEKYLKLKH